MYEFVKEKNSTESKDKFLKQDFGSDLTYNYLLNENEKKDSYFKNFIDLSEQKTIRRNH